MVSNFQVFKTSGKLETNSYYLTIDGVDYVVDPGKGIGMYLDSNKKYNVLITHGHYDHIAGILELNVGKIFISPEDSENLKTPSLNLSLFFDELFSVDVEWYNIDEYFTTIVAPGHTLGSRIILIEGHIFTGDVVFSNTIGRVDLYLDKDLAIRMREEMKKVIRNLREHFKNLPRESKICPGHGEIVSLKRLFEINPFFKL
ncbi:MAG: MBL fold metallo-hydrolase [Fervidobacterium sp.]